MEWLGDIPEHWHVRRLKHVCQVTPSNVDKKSHEGETAVALCNYTDVYYNDTIVADMNFMPATASDDQIAKFTLRAGDTIITKDSETADDIAVAAYVPNDLPGVVCGYHLSIVRPLAGTHGAFVKRFFDSSYAKSCFAVRANGLTRVGLSQYQIDNVILPVPPSTEQALIATFLDCETAKIDALIAEQQRLIELLKEKRQAVISHAVTKGLNPNARMKPSGIEWLGDIPEHWAITPLKWLTDPKRPIMYGIVLPGPDVSEGIPILKGGNVKPSRMNLQSMARTTPEIEAPYARARLKKGDLVYSIRGSIGDCEPVPTELEGSNITQDVARVAVVAGVCASWVRWALLSAAVREDLASGSLGAAVRGINIFDLKRADIPTPPLDEQIAIADYVGGENSRIEKLSAGAQHAIDLLRERRAALISAAVTGQIDARAFAERKAA
ncbi:restriction endonuclease subunit S [Reyranella sp.]|uniref:restriction endonuclease subunit S n=1 Tax=Reyranella sp. TaxID=1929291 RepID=UPI0025E22F52|nr:restriction endonuclease subunit S [Reyranella sp.]